MTLDSKLSKAVYQGNGSTTVFPFAFKVWDASQIAVTVTDAAGVSTDVTSNSTVTFTSSGGSVAYPKSGSPLPGGAKLAITRNMPFTQGINLTTASRFDPQVLEDGLDQATAERQQMLEQMARAVILPATSRESPEDVVASIYASRDAAAVSASAASTQATAAEGSAQAAANSASTAAQTVTTATADAVSAATAQANAAHDSALAAAQSAIDAAAAVPENLVARVTDVELVAASAKAVTDLATETPGAGKIPMAGADGSLVGWVPTGRRNRLHNGDFRIDQMNAGAAVTPSSTSYVADNCLVSLTQASKLTFQRISGSANLGCPASERVTIASAYAVSSADYFSIDRAIEGVDFADMLWGTGNAKPVTVSFQIYVSVAGTYSFSIRNHSATYSYVFTNALTVGINTVTAVIPGCTAGAWPSGNSRCMMLSLDLGSGSNLRTSTINSWVSGNNTGATGSASLVATLGAVYEISNVQIEAGSVATPFEFLPYQQSLEWCQRYYWKWTSGGAYNALAQGIMVTTAVGTFMVHLPVRMRVLPSVSYYAMGLAPYYTTAVIALSSLALSEWTSTVETQNILLNAIATTSIAAAVGADGNAWLVANGNNNSYVAFDACM